MKIYLDSIGCRLNQSEIEIMASQFRQSGHEIVNAASESDLVVINTCAVTNAAASDSRQKIRQAAKSGIAPIIATGCWVTLEPDMAKGLPGVENIVVNQEKLNLVSDFLHISPQIFDIEPLAREPLPGDHQRTRAFVKVQDGCDNFCTFCITKIARGKGVSIPIATVLYEIQNAVLGGVKEVVLSGVHLGSWGKDFQNGLCLSDLIKTILSDTDVQRIRLSSLEPWDLDDQFFELWTNHRLCNHLHLPLQSGSNSILRRMARKTTKQSYRKIINHAREINPEMAITTDMIVGFPGETDEDFSETLDFVQEIGFAGGHVFSFSARPGTPAAKYDMQVPGPIRKRRSAVLRTIFMEMAHIYQSKFIGKNLDVLWESSTKLDQEKFLLKGLSGNYIKVSAIVSTNRWNIVENIHLENFYQDSILGVIND